MCNFLGNGGNMRKKKNNSKKSVDFSKIWKGTYKINSDNPEDTIDKLKEVFRRIYDKRNEDIFYISKKFYSWDNENGYIIFVLAMFKKNIIITHGHLLLRKKGIGRHIWYKKIMCSDISQNHRSKIRVDIAFCDSPVEHNKDDENILLHVKNQVGIYALKNEESIQKELFNVEILETDSLLVTVKGH